MNNPWPALGVGAALFVLGIGLVRSHRRTWDGQRNDSSLGEKERTYYFRRYRRRMQTSALIAILGVLIGLGDLLLPLQKRQPLWPTLYWIGVLLLTGWVLLLGLGDFWSTAAHMKAELARARLRRRALERHVVEFKQRPLDDRERPVAGDSQ